jgi:hypothetical protein
MRGGRLLLALASFVVSVGVVEVAGRLVGFDFERKAHAFGRYPICYQQPTLPLGPYFRRLGPALWQGRPITAAMRMAGYAGVDGGDTEVTTSYDRDGFRNPDALTEWDLVVAGDSFTEGCSVGQEELFTTLAGKELDRRVKNLGVSFTGPLAQTLYLDRFGRSPSARDAVLAFFEGNDLMDLRREMAQRASFRGPPSRPPRSAVEQLPPQSSFVRALFQWVGLARKASAARRKPIEELISAEYVGGPTPIPLTLDFLPPGAAEVPAELRDGLDRALAEWAKTAEELGMTPWLLYLPAKRRVLDGLLSFPPQAPPILVDWKPADLPRWVAERARSHGIRVVDATPALVAEARAGVLPYNALFDSHLSREGHRVVARELADALRSGNAAPEPAP